MNKIFAQVLSAATTLLIGFYTGTQWNAKNINLTVSPPIPDPAFTKSSAIAQEKKTANSVANPPNFTTEAVSSIANSEKQTARVQTQAISSCPKPIIQYAVQDIGGFDSKKLNELYQQVDSEDDQQRQQALLALAKLGTDDVVLDLIQVAGDDEKNSELRRELIQQIDWSGHAKELSDIITASRDAEVRLAAVNAISPEKMTDEELTELEDALLENLRIEPEDGVKIATLNYILSVDPESFEQAFEYYSDELTTPEVQEYLHRIATPPPEENEQEIPADEQKDNLGG